MLKKTSLAILGLSLSGAVVAGTMGPSCTPTDVTVPCENNMWDIGVQALYLQSVYDADKAYGFTATAPIGYKEIKNEWDWGYRLEGSYHFSTGNDVSINWSHFSTDGHTDNLLGEFLITLPVVGPTLIPNPLVMKRTNRFDQVNAVLGQTADFGPFENARFYGGMQYAAIKDYGDIEFVNLPLLIQLGTHGINRQIESSFYGFGPVMGMDLAYHCKFNPNLSILAKFAGSILYGSARYSDTTHFNVGLVTQTNYASKKAIVPSLETKLGANYAMNVARGTLNIEAGYYAVNYFNALQNINTTAVVNSDYGLYGPYFGVTWLGNV